MGNLSIKWIGIVGARRVKTPQVEKDVRENVKKIMLEGNGIVSGGAWGVDYFAADEALKYDPTGQTIKVIIPSNLTTYHEYFNHQAEKGRITQDQINLLMSQLHEIKSRHAPSLIEMDNDSVYRKTFYARNTQVVIAADEIQAYQASGSQGTMNVVHKAQMMQKPLRVFDYPTPEFVK